MWWLWSNLRLAGDRDRDGVADAHLAREVQRLVDIDRAGAGELGAEHVRDQRAAPHAVRDDLAELRRAGVFRIDVGRIDVARHDGEHLDVFGPQGAHQRGSVADGDFRVDAILDDFEKFGSAHGVPLVSLSMPPLWPRIYCAAISTFGCGLADFGRRNTKVESLTAPDSPRSFLSLIGAIAKGGFDRDLSLSGRSASGRSGRHRNFRGGPGCRKSRTRSKTRAS